jgi:GNAT superfamily N-acetyltransferase
MNCTVLTAAEFAKDREAVLWIADRLSRHGSDFQEKLRYWLAGHLPQQADGLIAIVRDFGEIVGWARCEDWKDQKTLEAFVAENYRGRGIASYATHGLLASGAFGNTRKVAVFRSSEMVSLSVRCGLFPTLYTLQGSQWVRV